MEKLNFTSVPQDPSRRRFIKNLSTIAAGAILAGGLNSCDTETNTEENNVKDNTNNITEVLQSGNLENILKNKYLVSALYYSNEALTVIKNKNEAERTPQENTILQITQIINSEHRNKYMDVLRQKVEHENLSPKLNKPLDKFEAGNILKNHKDAVDLFTEEGSSIYSVSSGVVLLAEDGWNKNDLSSTSSQKGGNTIIIYDDAHKRFYRYAHLNEINVKAGDILDTDTVIGTVGHTGINASKPGHGNHLHFEINIYDQAENHNRAMSAAEIKGMLDRIK